MRRLLLALPLILAACGPQPSQEKAAEPPAEQPTTPPAAAPTSEAPAPAPAETPAAPAPVTPVPAPAAKPAAAAPPAAAPVSTADLDNGQMQFARCRTCHTIEAGGRDMIGPNLHGVFGRKAGSKAAYVYSPALQAAGFTWDAAKLDAWIASPRDLVPGNKMAFIGIKTPKDRADLVAYLKAETAK